MVDFENEASEVRKRIIMLLKEKGITQNAVASGNTPAQKRINSQINHGVTLSLDTILRIVYACPDVSTDWLLRGTGKMLLGNTADDDMTGDNATIVSRHTLSEAFVLELLAQKDKQLLVKDKQIQTLLQLLER